jgi:hypothetical protein
MNTGQGIWRRSQLVVVAVMACRGPVHAGPRSLASEDVSPGIRINGVSLHVVRLTGVGVADFARELQRSWYPAQEAGSSWAQVGGWRVLSRRTGHWSEVLQVREGGSPEEALLSRIDVEHRPAPVGRLMLELPASCRVTSTVEFAQDTDKRMQVSASCAARPAEVIAAIQSGAKVAGWRQDARSGGSMQGLTRGSTQVTVLVGDDRQRPGRSGSWLVAVERKSQDAPP